MSATPSAIVSKIRQEASLFDSKDRLLNFTSKGDFQSPLIMEAGDLFYEKWHQSNGPLPLDSFFPITANFTVQQKIVIADAMTAVLREKDEDFGESDLYLVLGFLKWDGNALAPSLLIPVNADIRKKTVSLSNRPPIENVILRERLKDKIVLPKAEDAIINGQFSILLYFSLFEKAIAAERNWKFTRHGFCLGFFNTGRLLLKKQMEQGWADKMVEGNPVLPSLLSEDGFEIQESLFEESAFDQVFSPADHHFLYLTDSHTTKVTVDALNEKACAYAIQALPGTGKMKVAANIVADSVAKKQKVLVVSRRSVTANGFQNTWKPPYRTFTESDRPALEQEIRQTRKDFQDYYATVNSPLQPTGIMLSDLLTEFIKSKAPKQKFPEKIFEGVANLDYTSFQSLKNDLEQLVELYFDKKGFEARKAFQSVKVPSLPPEKKANLAEELNKAAASVQKLSNVMQLLETAGLCPTGIFLTSLADILKLIQDNFDSTTPTFEEWQLRSNSWVAYRDTLLDLSKAGDTWVQYRRKNSEIYTDNAEDENILSAREDFAESQKIALKGLSDRYRSSRKRLLQVFKNPRSIANDAQLLEYIDALLDLQENKKAYKESAVLGNHLLGKDWLYEKSNWSILDEKIHYIYDFREKNKKNPKLELLLQVLEQWHLFKDIQPELAGLYETALELQKSIRQISKDMDLETSLECLDMYKWLDTIKQWSENWGNLDIHLQLSSLFKKIEEYNCTNLVEFVKDTSNVNKDIAQAVVHHWIGAQIQATTRRYPELFAINPKARAQKSKAYRELLDKFSNANFKELHDSLEQDPSLLTTQSLNQFLASSRSCTYDIAIVMDADCISVVEALPIILCANKVILIGDAHGPNLEHLPFDAYQENDPPHTAVFQESILTASLRQGIPTRELWFSTQYADTSLIGFANSRIYNHGIKQLPAPHKSVPKAIKFNVVSDKVLAVAQAAVRHADKHPGQTLGIVAFHQSTCHEIEAAIQAMVNVNTPAARFFGQTNANIRYYVKTPERAVDKFRDVIFVCAEAEGVTGLAGEKKIAVCTTLAKQETRVFISESDMSKQVSTKTKQALFWDWIAYLQAKDYSYAPDVHVASSAIRPMILDTLRKENLNVEEMFASGGIPVGPAIVDANNPDRFLALVEDDCTTERFRDSVEDRDYIRPTILKQLGWKVINLWLPFWYMANGDEASHLTTTIAIEQSVAPPPSEGEPEEEEDFEEVSASAMGPTVEPYVVQHPKIEGTPHDKPIAELPVTAIVTQLKFYVDHEAPIHEDILTQRVLELHHVDRAGPVLQQVLTEAINQGLQKKRFVKTGRFFYSLTSANVTARDRSQRPASERKLIYVSPEERAVLPASMDEYALKQALGLLE